MFIYILRQNIFTASLQPLSHLDLKCHASALWKTGLTKLLYQKGYSRTGVLNLYAFIDWVLTLPEALEKIFLEDLREFEKEKKCHM
jgi:hypothetical protein